MKKIMLITLVSILFVSCNVVMGKFDYYFESGHMLTKFQVGSGEDTLTVKKINALVRTLEITEPISDTVSGKTVFRQDELAKPVDSKFTQVTISSDQIKVVVKENDVTYDREILLTFSGPGTSKEAMQTVGQILITQKAKQ